jgi:hypothetical protein
LIVIPYAFGGTFHRRPALADTELSALFGDQAPDEILVLDEQ